jgi:hypothetical protein
MAEYDNFEKIQGSGSYTVTSELWNCTLCGTVVYDQELHMVNAHPVAQPFEGEDEVDLDELPSDEEIDEEEAAETQTPTETVVVNPNGS